LNPFVEELKDFEEFVGIKLPSTARLDINAMHQIFEGRHMTDGEI